MKTLVLGGTGARRAPLVEILTAEAEIAALARAR
jgi:hypothetical protein